MLDERDLITRIGPILRDGTPFRDLIDLDRREVSFRVMNDPEIHELELQKIFAKCWVVVGHALEIPNPGDFVLRYIGQDQVIVIRDNDGEINILLNVCAHRGMEVCRNEAGNQLNFMCPYHGWAYNAKGRLVGAPIEKEMYGDWDKSDPAYGLLRAQVEVMANGAIFGNFDQNAPSLDDYLGDIKWYFDSTLGDVDPSEVMIMGTDLQPRTRLGGNWKVLNDQLWGDNYHGVTLHRSSTEIEGFNPMRGGAAIRSTGGHVVNGLEVSNTKEEAAELIRTGMNNKRIFPVSGVGGGVGGDRTGIVDLTTVIPRGPGDSELLTIFVATRDGLASMLGKDFIPKNIGGPLNMVFGDDAMQAPAVQRAALGAVARKFVTMKYAGRYGEEDAPPENFPGPAPSWDRRQGAVHVNARGVLKDESEWAWWLKYYDVMTADD